MDLIKKMENVNVLPKCKVEDGADPTRPVITHLTSRSQTLLDNFCVTYLADKTVRSQEYESFIVNCLVGGDFEFITATVPLSGTLFPGVPCWLRIQKSGKKNNTNLLTMITSTLPINTP